MPTKQLNLIKVNQILKVKTNITMNPIEGSKILAFGQEAIIEEVIIYNGITRCYLDRSIVVDTKEYTRDYIDSSEIQEVIEV